MSAVIAPPVSPFKGLAAFEDSELDALFFFGREREREIVVANLLASRLTVLYGESGVGKSSLLGAGVARELRALAHDAVVVVHDTWSGSVDSVLAEAHGAAEAYVILDQFEEYFLYYGVEDRPGTLLHDLPELLHGSRVNVLISLREDTLSQLDAFKARIPSVFANQVRLEHLDRDSARAAILGPIARWNELTDDPVEIEPALVEAVLDEVAAGRVEGRADDRDRIEAPYLQLVLERIWETERSAGSALLRLATLRALGGASSIVSDHLEGSLASLSADEQDVAAEMFEHLVTPSGTKIAHRAPDLAQYAQVPEDTLLRVLSRLTRDRIVHSVDGSDRYEIFHDVLAEPIQAWRRQRRLERERLDARRRQRRLYVLSAASLVALAIVAGLAVWAFAERGTARSEARHARARELEATALQQLTTDPNRSVRLGLAAARLEPGRASETVLRQALIADRLRAVVFAGEPVRAVASSPNGKLVAATAQGGLVLVAAARNGHVLRKLTGAAGAASLGFSRDGRTLIAASAGGVGTAWDSRTGRRLSELGRFGAAPGPDGRMETFPLRGDLARVLSHVKQVRAGRGLVAAVVTHPDRRVRAWIFDARGRRLHVLPQDGILDVAFSRDGRYAATGSYDGTSTIWNTRTWARYRVFPDAPQGVSAVAFSPDGKLLATGGKDSGVRIWTIATRQRTFFLFGHTNPVTTVAWSPDGRVVASGSTDRTTLLWRVQRQIGVGSLAATLAGDTDAVRALAFSRDSTRLVTGSDDGTVRVWDAQPDQELHHLVQTSGAVVGTRWAGNSIAVASSRGTLEVVDARTRRVAARVPPDGAQYTSLGVSRDGRVLVAGAADGRTIVWDRRPGGGVTRHDGPAPVLAAAVAPGGGLAASGDRRGTVRVLDTSNGGVRWSRSAGGEVADVVFSPAGDLLAAAGPDGATIWAAATGRLLHRLPVADGLVRLAFSSDGRLLAGAGADGTARLWFATTGNAYRVLRGHKGPLTDIAFSRDDTLLATSSQDADGRVWSVTQGRLLRVLRGHFGTVAGIGFSPNGGWIVTGGPISAGLWPVSTGRLLFYLRGHTTLVTSVSFSADGLTVLSASRDGTVRTYRCEVCVGLNGLIQLAELRLSRT